MTADAARAMRLRYPPDRPRCRRLAAAPVTLSGRIALQTASMTVRQVDGLDRCQGRACLRL